MAIISHRQCWFELCPGTPAVERAMGCSAAFGLDVGMRVLCHLESIQWQRLWLWLRSVLL